MDGSNLYNLSNSVRNSRSTRERTGSLRSNSSAIWRSSGMEVFSKSARDDDDEEALKWAALEKLPTFDRLRKGLLLGSQGAGASEIDIDNLGTEERKKILERLVNVAEEDNEKFLLKLRDRVDRVGIDLPLIEVRFEHLKIAAEAHVGSRALPSFLNFNISIVEGLLDTLRLLPNRKQQLTILDDVSGILRPCRMTLLLGPPSSGKTTLLLALAGKLDPTLKFSGRVTYNGHEMTEFVPKRTAAYISQHDLHIGEMTVRETLAFSARCQGVGSRYEMLAELSRREKDANIKPDPDVDLYMKAAATEGQEASVVTDYVLKILGLDVCADTMVGDQMIRGISGGQRKRVTTGEMLVGPSKALFMDEISTERKGVADFLQEVTSKKDQKQYWLRKDEPYRFITAMEFSEAYQSFHVGLRLGDDLATPYDKNKSHPAALTTDNVPTYNNGHYYHDSVPEN
ncbi:Pigment permease [Heracleum sosnowskyi]|uniref:Pigment permease n=1 Tax=Heracleum sosnowskyi TaxID=360622 RepID=A0AAD8MKD0_9APIA|nr:Pigment permease [Heracleum sosnowskyi]